MGDYDFSGLSPRSFEHMVQALSFKILGRGLSIFGDGPDGGREAIFRGKTEDFPSNRSPWDGITIVQVKFRQRPSKNNENNQEWVLTQLKKDLEQLFHQRPEHSKPDYYILATNVILTPVKGTGGKDRAEYLFKDYEERIGIRDHRIWDYDQICRFLDENKDVRDAYAAWTTPGDVLEELKKKFSQGTPSFFDVMQNYLQKEMLDDQFSKLEQAGFGSEDQIPLEHVFIDIPAFMERQFKPPIESLNEDSLPPGFLAKFIEDEAIYLGADNQSSAGLGMQNSEPNLLENGRYVLIGGPGQGKTTLAQYLCQIHRANLLQESIGLDIDAKKARDSILKHSEKQGINLAAVRRFPIFIKLSQFAIELAMDREPRLSSVLEYISQQITIRTKFTVTIDNLRNWFREHPWLLILDGLDEVPASSNRKEVLKAIRDFQVDIAQFSSNVLILGTTRPQGYNDEFSEKRYAHFWLAPLSKVRALFYGKKLMESTYRSAEAKKEEYFKRLAHAAEEEATARLMESPLQITIMARLLTQIPTPPRERYQLFREYYRVMFDREKERNIELSPLLATFGPDINSIHYRTGLVLQIESERVQRTDATISIGTFRDIVRGRLSEEGHEKEELNKLTEEIVACAMQRLVFLVPSQEDRIGFEIRSLQEFMAAEALMDGGDIAILERIREIAAIPFWQNILLFAAGKCYIEKQHLRELISGICIELNSHPSDPMARIEMSGSRMALALIEDGTARNQPASFRALVKQALALIDFSDNEANYSNRLTALFEPNLENLYREELEKRLRQKDFNNQRGAWQLLMKLISIKEPKWALDYINKYMSTNPEEMSMIYEIGRENISLSTFRDQIQKVFFMMPEDRVRNRIVFGTKNSIETIGLFSDIRIQKYLSLVTDRILNIETKIPIHWDLRDHYEMKFVSLSRSNELFPLFAEIRNHHESWITLQAAGEFAMNPVKERLASALFKINEISKDNWGKKYFFSARLPWPLDVCLKSARNNIELKLIAESIERGEMGDKEDWYKAEERWKTKNVTLDDIKYMEDCNWPIPKEIAKIGVPINGMIDLHSGIGLDDVIKIWKLLPGQKARNNISSELITFLNSDKIGKWPNEIIYYQNKLKEIIIAINRGDCLKQPQIKNIYEIWGESDGTKQLMDCIGKTYDDIWVDYEGNQLDKYQEILSFISKSLYEDPLQTGMIILLATMAVNYGINESTYIGNGIEENEKGLVEKSRYLLELCRKDLSEEELAKKIDIYFEKYGSESKNIKMLIKIILNHIEGYKSINKILEQVWTHLSDRTDIEREDIIWMASIVIAQRESGFRNRNTWKKMDLPEKLFDVLEK